MDKSWVAVVAVFVASIVACSAPPDLEGQDTSTGADAPSHGRLNFVFIVADDQPYNMLGAAGNPVIRTPNLDDLAEQGVYFERAYLTIGQCGASRATFLTGQLPHEHGIIKNGDEIDLDQPIVPRLLRDAGYRTAMIGKCHLESDPYYEEPEGGGGKVPVNPDPFTEKLGFEHRVLFYPDKGYLDDFYTYDIVRTGVPEHLDGSNDNHYATNLLTDEAIAYARERARNNEPFFLWVAYNVPHEPFFRRNRPPEFNPKRSGEPGYAVADMPTSPNEVDDLSSKPPQQRRTRSHRRFVDLDHADVRRFLRNSYEMVENMDSNIGRLLAALEQDRLLDHTVIVFVSDNGQFFGEHQMYTKGATFYDEQIRTPLLIWMPNAGRSGKTDTLVSSLDLAPTILELAEQESPEEVTGRSLVPLLKGTAESVRDSAYMEYGGWRSSEEPMRGLVWDRYKFVHYFETRADEGHGFELYDLLADPYEMNNLLPYTTATDNAFLAGLRHEGHGADLQQIRREMAIWQTTTADPYGLDPLGITARLHDGQLTIHSEFAFEAEVEVHYREHQCSTCAWIRVPNEASYRLGSSVSFGGLDDTVEYDLRIFVFDSFGNGAVRDYSRVRSRLLPSRLLDIRVGERSSVERIHR